MFKTSYIYILAFDIKWIFYSETQTQCKIAQGQAVMVLINSKFRDH